MIWTTAQSQNIIYSNNIAENGTWSSSALGHLVSEPLASTAPGKQCTVSSEFSGEVSLYSISLDNLIIINIAYIYIYIYVFKQKKHIYIYIYF